jgi:undecaprenyl pyrophosphate synthase
MKLPNPEQAIIDSEKLSGYCLNPEHPDGQHKARVFQSVLGLRQENEEELRNALKEALKNYNAAFERENSYGKKYIIDFSMNRGDKQAIVRSVWIVRFEENFPRLVTCYIP